MSWPPEQKGGLDLRTLSSMRKGGKTGPALVPGSPAEGPVVQRIASGELQTLEQWIRDGAVEDREEPASADSLRLSKLKPAGLAFNPPADRPPAPDHGPSGFSVWLAGGGTRGGLAYGSTGEIGYRAADNRVGIHDFHATVLHLPGLNHRALVYQRKGRGERITDDFPARVVNEIFL